MSLPSYDDYKIVDIPWLTDLPVSWRVKRIKHTTYLKGRVGWKGLTSDEYLEDGYAYLVTGTDFSKKFISWHECHCVDSERYEDDPFIQLRNGDLLITKDGTIGKLALVENLDRPACLNSGIFLVRPTSDYVTPYMYWVLQSEAFKVFCDLSSLGSTIQHLYQNIFEDFSFPIPSIDEQTAIAAFLDRETAKIDALIAEQEKLIALLAEKRQATISHAVTRGLNPDAPMKDSGVAWLGEVPAHWGIRKLKSLTSRIGDGLHGTPTYVDESDYFFINGNNLVEGSIAFFENTRNVSEQECSSQAIPLSQSTVLLSINGTIGNFAFYSGEKVMLGKSAAYVNCSFALDRRYLAYFVQADGCKNYFLDSLIGTTIHNLSLETIRATPVPIPSLVEQESIISFLETETGRLNALIKHATHGIALLKERRSALIAAAVTGQIDVRALA